MKKRGLGCGWAVILGWLYAVAITAWIATSTAV